MKKILSMMLVICLLASAGIPAFAANTIITDQSASKSASTEVWAYIGTDTGTRVNTYTVSIPSVALLDEPLIVECLEIDIDYDKAVAVGLTGLRADDTLLLERVDPDTKTVIKGAWARSIDVKFGLQTHSGTAQVTNNSTIAGYTAVNSTHITMTTDNMPNVAGVYKSSNPLNFTVALVGINSVPANLLDVPSPSSIVLLEDTPWERIAEVADDISARGLNASQVEAEYGLKIGDTKDIVIAGDNHTVRILGFNHDIKESGGTAGITFELTGFADAVRIENTETNVNGWVGSRMRTVTLSETGDLFTGLPAELQAAIKPVVKSTSAGNQSPVIVQSTEKLFLLSEFEVFGSSVWSFPGEGSQYAYYVGTGQSAKYKPGSELSSSYTWWLRSPHNNDSTGFCTVHYYGSPNTYAATSSHGVSFGFSI